MIMQALIAAVASSDSVIAETAPEQTVDTAISEAVEHVAGRNMDWIPIVATVSFFAPDLLNSRTVLSRNASLPGRIRSSRILGATARTTSLAWRLTYSFFPSLSFYLAVLM